MVTSTFLSQRLRITLAVVLTLTGIYLYGFPSANAAYAIGILTHVVLGAGLALLLLPGVMRLFRGEPGERTPGLAAHGDRRRPRPGAAEDGRDVAVPAARLHAHRRLDAGRRGAPLVVAATPRDAGRWRGNRAAMRYAVVRARGWQASARGTWYTRVVWWRDAYRIVNPTMPPESMQAEGLGRRGRSSRARSGRPTATRSSRRSSWTRSPASAATRTSTTSGSARRTTSRRSTTSGIARASSTCRTSVGTRAVEVVRRMPRSGGALQRPDGYAHQADRATVPNRRPASAA